MANSSLSLFVLSLLLILSLVWRVCDAFRSVGFDLHNVYSDPVKGVLGIHDELPVKGSREYYVAMSHRDRLLHRGRGLSSVDPTPLTFMSGNDTHRIASLGLYVCFLLLLIISSLSLYHLTPNLFRL